MSVKTLRRALPDVELEQIGEDLPLACGRTVIVASRTANTAQWSLRIVEMVGVEYLQKMFKDDVLHRLMNARHVGVDR